MVAKLKIRAQVKAALHDAGFPLACRPLLEDAITEIVIEARFLRHCRYFDYETQQYHRYPKSFAHSQGRPREKEARFVVFQYLHRAWWVHFGKRPKINNAGYPASPFVIFVEKVMHPWFSEKLENRLEEFRSFQKQIWQDNALLLQKEALEKN